MRRLLLILAFLIILISCSKSDTDIAPQSCYSEKPTLIGKWVLTEFRYYGGCCPVITDTTWKKATENTYSLEFTVDGKVNITNTLSGSNGLISSMPARLSTNYQFNGITITVDEQILGGAYWNKNVDVTKLTTHELIIDILVGKEGETNERKFIRSCN